MLASEFCSVLALEQGVKVWRTSAKGGSQVVTLRVRHVWISSVRGLPSSQACVSEPALHYSP